MIIYGKAPAFHRPQRKPQAWGPVSAVRASIFKNAERIGASVPSLYYPFWEKAGQTVKNYGAVGFQSGTATFPTWDTTGLKFTASSSQYIYSDKLPISNGTGSITMMCRANPAATGSQQTLMAQRIGSGSYNTIALMVHTTHNLGAHNNAFSLFCFENPNYQSGTNYLGFDGKYHTYTGVRPSSGTLRINVDGDDLALTTSSTPSTTRNVYNSGQAFAVGRLGPSALYYYNDSIDYTAVYNDYNMPDSIIAYLSDNPYFFLQRVAPVYYSIPSTGGGSLVPIKFNKMVRNNSLLRR